MRMQILFVTVGTTKFEGLIESLNSDAVIRVLRQAGFGKVIIQKGNSKAELNNPLWRELNIDLVIYDRKPSIQDDIDLASLVISHAGAGTILECLDQGKKLIVVVNETLLGNHQSDLAQKLHNMGCLRSTDCSGLANAIRTFDSCSLTALPPPDRTAFGRLLDAITKPLLPA